MFALPLALFVAWFTARQSSLDQRKAVILEDLTDHINETQRYCDEVAQELQSYLTGDGQKEPLKDGYKKLLIRFKEANRKAEHLGMYFDESTSKNIGDMHQTWWRELTKENFPVPRKVERNKPNDPTIKRIMECQTAWDTYLAELKHKCFQEEIVFWRVKRRFRWRG